MEPIVQLNSNAKLSEHLASPSEATLGHSNKLDGSHLSPHFKLGEFTKSSSHPEVYNIPSHEAIANLKRVCEWLEVLRKRYNERYNACHLEHHPSVMSSGVERSALPLGLSKTSPRGDHEISPRAALGRDDKGGALGRDDKGGALSRDDKGGGTLGMTTAPVSSRPSAAHGEISEKPIIINSGYRSPQLNRKIGGVKNSNHLTGCAVDIRVTGMEQAKQYAEILREYPDESHQDFDELLIEKNRYGAIWLHFAVRPRENRRRFLYINA